MPGAHCGDPLALRAFGASTPAMQNNLEVIMPAANTLSAPLSLLVTSLLFLICFPKIIFPWPPTGAYFPLKCNLSRGFRLLL